MGTKSHSDLVPDTFRFVREDTICERVNPWLTEIKHIAYPIDASPIHLKEFSPGVFAFTILDDSATFKDDKDEKNKSWLEKVSLVACHPEFRNCLVLVLRMH